MPGWILATLLLGVPAHAEDPTDALCRELLRTTPSPKRVRGMVAAGADPHGTCLVADYTTTVDHIGNLGQVFLGIATAGMWTLVGPDSEFADGRKWASIPDLVLQRRDPRLLAALIGDERADPKIRQRFTALVAAGEVDAALFAASVLDDPPVEVVGIAWANPHRLEALLRVGPSFRETARLDNGDWLEHPASVERLLDAGMPPAGAESVASTALGHGEIDMAASLQARGVPMVLRGVEPELLDDPAVITAVLALEPRLAGAYVDWDAALAGDVDQRLVGALLLCEAGAPTRVLTRAFSAAVRADRLELAARLDRDGLAGDRGGSRYPIERALDEIPGAEERRAQLRALKINFRYLDFPEGFWTERTGVLEDAAVMAFLDATEAPLCDLVHAGVASGADFSLLIQTDNDLGECVQLVRKHLDAPYRDLALRIARDTPEHPYDLQRSLEKLAFETHDGELLDAVLEHAGSSELTRALDAQSSGLCAAVIGHWTSSSGISKEDLARLRALDLDLVILVAERRLADWGRLLGRAADEGDHELVEALLTHGQFDRDDLSSALDRWRPHPELAARLLDLGVQPDGSHLSSALRGAHWSLATRMLELGVEPEVKSLRFGSLDHIEMLFEAPSAPPPALIHALRAQLATPVRWWGAWARAWDWPSESRAALIGQS